MFLHALHSRLGVVYGHRTCRTRLLSFDICLSPVVTHTPCVIYYIMFATVCIHVYKITYRYELAPHGPGVGQVSGANGLYGAPHGERRKRGGCLISCPAIADNGRKCRDRLVFISMA